MPYRSTDLAALAQGDHTDAVIALEDQTAQDTLGRMDDDFTALTRRTVTAWTLAFGSATAAAVPGAALLRLLAAVRAAVRRLLGNLAPRATTTLHNVLADAAALGARQGTAFLLAASSRRYAIPAVRPSRSLLDTAARIAAMVTDRRDRALALLRPDQVRTWSHLLTGIAAGRAAIAAVRAHIAWTVNGAVNEGLDRVVRAASVGRLWVAEADACVRCLAYTGRTAAVGEPFPGGLSWDPRQRRTGAPGVDGPPLHGHCRCRAVPWSDAWVADGVPFPLALQREAHRSLAYGSARASESTAARIRAARELLRVENDLLPAVEARARAALRAGRFAVAA